MTDPRSSDDPNLKAALKVWDETSHYRDRSFDEAMQIRTALYNTSSHRAYGWAALTCGRIASYREQLDLAEVLLTEALGRFTFVGDKYGESVAFAHLAIPEIFRRNLDHAQELALKALSSGVTFSDRDADLLHNIAAQCHWTRGECHAAILHLTKAYEFVKNTSDHNRRSVVIGNLGVILQDLGEWELALSASTEAWRLQLDHCKDRREIQLSHFGNMISANINLGDFETALRDAESLLELLATRNPAQPWIMFGNLCEVFALNGRVAEANHCLARVRALTHANPTPHTIVIEQLSEALVMESTKDYRRAIVLAKEALILPTTKIRRVLHRTAAKILARSYAALGNRAESAKWKKFANESGRDELLGNMLSSQIRASLKPEQPTEPLTEHEIICLSMSAHGQTSTDIALKLGVKPRTINFHFTKILRKLNAMNRQEAIAKASEANLLRRL